MATFERLVAVRQFITYCVLPENYHFPDSFVTPIALTASGRDALEAVRAEFPDATEADAYAALLGVYAVEEQEAIDAAATNLDGVIDVLSREIARRRIQFPWVFGRTLDIAFSDEYGATGGNTTLTHLQSIDLLSRVPQGVFQVHDLVCGPLGILSSRSVRTLLPTVTGPHALCDEPGCDALHGVDVRTGTTESSKIFAHLGAMPTVSFSQGRAIDDALAPNSLYYAPDTPIDFPALLGNGLTSGELRQLVGRLLSDNTDGVRETLTSAIPQFANQSTAQIISAITDGHALQLCLVASDETLVSIIEQMIDEGELAIAPTETRRSLFSYARSAFRTRAELSRFGVRFHPSAPGYPVFRTEALLHSLFGEEQGAELEWLLRSENGTDAGEKLGRYLQRVEPSVAVKELLFSSRGSLERGFAELRFGHFKVPSNRDEELALLEKVLWKLGHSAPPPERPDARLRFHLEELIHASSSNSEEREGRTRSAASNVFVNLESVLTRALEFAAWALFSDHYSQPPHDRFTYTTGRARITANEVLRARNSEKFQWDPSGKNSLYPLFFGFTVLADACDEVLLQKHDFRRDRAEFPTAIKTTSIFRFPLTHKLLLLDFKSDALRRLTTTFREIQAESERSKICDTRNRFSHAGDEFPDHRSVEGAVAGIERVLRLLLSDGLMANVYRLTERRIDSFDREVVTFSDAAGDSVTVVNPNLLMFCGLPGLKDPQLVLREGVLNGSDQPVRFSVEEETEWLEEWRTLAARAGAGGDGAEFEAVESGSIGEQEQVFAPVE